MTDGADAQVIETELGPVEYLDSGGSGPAVLFVHGTPGGCDQGALMGEFLVEAGFRTIAPSRPGYLGTPLTDERSTPHQQAALHAALLDGLGVDRCGLMCWSGGGPSSYQLAIDAPERITRLVAVAAVAKPYTFEHPSEEKALFTHPGAWLMKQMAKHAPKATVKAMVGEEGDLTRAQTKELVHQVWEDEATRSWVLRWVATVSGHRTAGFDNDRHRFPDVDLALGSIEVPVLLVHADTDSDVPFEHSEHAAEVLATSETLVIENGTHISLWTGPGDVHARGRVAEFLRGA